MYLYLNFDCATTNFTVLIFRDNTYLNTWSYLRPSLKSSVTIFNISLAMYLRMYSMYEGDQITYRKELIVLW